MPFPGLVHPEPKLVGVTPSRDNIEHVDLAEERRQAMQRSSFDFGQEDRPVSAMKTPIRENKDPSPGNSPPGTAFDSESLWGATGLCRRRNDDCRARLAVANLCHSTRSAVEPIGEGEGQGVNSQEQQGAAERQASAGARDGVKGNRRTLAARAPLHALVMPPLEGTKSPRGLQYYRDEEVNERREEFIQPPQVEASDQGNQHAHTQRQVAHRIALPLPLPQAGPWQ